MAGAHEVRNEKTLTLFGHTRTAQTLAVAYVAVAALCVQPLKKLDATVVLALQQTCSVASAVHWTPTVPRAGSLFHVALRKGSAFTPSTLNSFKVAGEPLHFHENGDSLFALAAIPVDSIKGVSLTLRCDDGTRTNVRIPTQSGAYPLEKLTVAPEFSAPPDSALTERMRKETALAAEVSRASHSTPRLWTKTFRAPRDSRITSAFGGGRTFNGAVTSRHMGTDFAGAVGAPVHATNRGVVRLIGAFYLGGNVIYIDHGEGIVSAYLHLSKQLVAVGDTVQQGTVIGHVGATGRVTGPHLHFIARYGQITVDAKTLLTLR